MAAAPKPRKTASIFFLMPAWSAMAPRMGDSTAMRVMDIAVAKAMRAVATTGARSAPATLVK